MGTNDERTMILSMLKEGKITIDEADALLDVLDETKEDQEPGGFASADDVDDEDHGGDKKDRGFRFGIDISGLRDSLRDTMKGVSDTLKEAFEGLSELDLGGEIFRAMGRIRAESEREISVKLDDATELKLSNKWGDVRITGNDSDTIEVHAKITTWSAATDKAKKAADAMQIELARDGDAWVLKSSLEDREGIGVRVDYELTVPRSVRVSASTASGDLWLEDLDSSQVMNSLSGDISIANLGSGLADSQEMHTKSGDVVAGSLNGDITISSLSGDIMINGFHGALTATTKSGDIQIKDGRGCVKLRTMSGDLRIELIELGEDNISLSTVSGDVDLRLPESAGISLSAKSTSGDVDSSLDLSVTNRTDHVLEGTVGDGAVHVKISTVSGDIEIASS